MLAWLANGEACGRSELSPPSRARAPQVRWTLLVSGVLEMEVVEQETLTAGAASGLVPLPAPVVLEQGQQQPPVLEQGGSSQN